MPDEEETAAALEKARGAEAAAAKVYQCECIDCGEKLETEEHCANVTCPQCGGEMRRADRPGPGDRRATKAAGALPELLFVGEASIQAVAKGPPKISIVAYTGGELRIDGWPAPLVVHLNGIQLAATVPIHLDHDRTAPLGHGRPSVRDGALGLDGVVSFAESERGREFLAAARAGFPWKASIGADPLSRVEHEPGSSFKANGRTFTAGSLGLYEIPESRLKEVSVLSLAADTDTEVHVAAGASKERTMGKKTTDGAPDTPPESTPETPPETPAAPPIRATAPDPTPSGRDVDSVIAKAKAERERVRQITALIEEAASIRGADLDALDTLAAKAIDENWAIRDLELALLRMSRPRSPGIHSEAPPDGLVLEAAAMLAVSRDDKALNAAYGDQVLSTADRRFGRSIGLQEMILAAAKANGYGGRNRITPGNYRDMLGWACPPPQLRAAGGFSTVDLTGILGNVANKALAAVAAEPQWLVPLLCGVASHANFHAHTIYSLAMTGELLPVGPTGELRHLALGEESYQRQIGTRGAILKLSRTDVINDDLGVFARNANGLARKALTTREKALFTLICASGAGASHFTAARGNYLAGGTTAFGASGMADAMAGFRALTGPDGDPIMVEPAIVLLPPTLEDAGRRLLAAGSVVVMYNIEDTTSARGTSANIWAGRFGGAPLVSPWLENATLTGHSAAYWYVLADPKVYPCFEIAYLNGQQTPTVEYFGLDADVDTLGMSWRVYWDFGVANAEWRAGVKLAGA